MERFTYIVIILMSILFFPCCNSQLSRMELLDEQDRCYYSSDYMSFKIIETINDSIGIAEDYDGDVCVIITDELCYDGKYIHEFNGEWQVIGTWKSVNCIYPVIKFIEWNDDELIEWNDDELMEYWNNYNLIYRY